MFLKTLKLTNFRNYKKLDYKFDHPITVLVGDNAQGKTNFLESIYFLATTKSQRADGEEELVRHGEDVLRVEGDVAGINLEIAMQFTEGSKKKIKVNGIPRRTAEYSENLAVVMFSPEDINLVTGSPSLRRDHIDQTLSQIDRHYKKSISNYENIVTRKNKLLKSVREGFAKAVELDYWSAQQIKFGDEVMTKRKEFFEYLNNAEKKFGDYKYEYLPSVLTPERLFEYQSREIESAMSLVGPHRDDFLFVLNGLDLSKFGSRGEQRTAVLDLKISEVAFIERKFKHRPILLLDDIFSELDLAHRQHVVDLANLQQTVITTIELDKYLQTKFKEAKVLVVEAGKVVDG